MVQAVRGTVRLRLAAEQDRAVAFTALWPAAVMFFQLQQRQSEEWPLVLLCGFRFFRHGNRRQMAFLVVDLLDAVAGIGFLVAGITAEMQTLAVRCPDHGIAGDGFMGNFGEMFSSTAGRPMIRYAAAHFPK